MPEDPKFWRNKQLVFGLENEYGTSAALTAADAIQAIDVSFNAMEGQDLDRELEQVSMANNGSFATDLHSTISFSVDLVGSGTPGTPPPWGRLLRACGCAETIVADTSVRYTPISQGFESGTLNLVVGGTLYAMRGMRGNAEFMLDANQAPKIKFDMMGLFAVPTETAPPATDLSGWQTPLVVNSVNTPTFTIGGTDFVMSTAKFMFGNAVEPRLKVGVERILITDKGEKFETTVDAQPVTSFDPFVAARDHVQMPVQMVHGNAPGQIITLDLPTAQMQRPTVSNSQKIKEWGLNLIPRAATANSQFALTLT